jgi:hypothetical protein
MGRVNALFGEWKDGGGKQLQMTFYIYIYIYDILDTLTKIMLIFYARFK